MIASLLAASQSGRIVQSSPESACFPTASCRHERSAEVMVDGLSVIRRAQKYAESIVAVDQILSRNIEDFASQLQLLLAGCLRAIGDERQFHDASQPGSNPTQRPHRCILCAARD
eukprot:1564648-Prymnesium_polylepis.3